MNRKTERGGERGPGREREAREHWQEAVAVAKARRPIVDPLGSLPELIRRAALTRADDSDASTRAAASPCAAASPRAATAETCAAPARSSNLLRREAGGGGASVDN